MDRGRLEVIKLLFIIIFVIKICYFVKNLYYFK